MGNMSEKKYLILSDIHGNVSAFESVLKDCGSEEFVGVFLLGDCIDYGMRSNEIIEKLILLKNNEWKGKVLTDIRGNHEQFMIDGGMEKISSDRGRVMARYTADKLSAGSFEYIKTEMEKSGKSDVDIEGKRILVVHGSLEDPFWKSIEPGDLRGDYREYDIVLSGHSHYSHCFGHFYPVDDPDLRNKKIVVFINPGSVGQPRNQNPCAQYAVMSLPSGRVELRAVKYDIIKEQSLYTDEVDEFYKTRLSRGI